MTLLQRLRAERDELTRMITGTRDVWTRRDSDKRLQTVEADIRRHVFAWEEDGDYTTPNASREV